MPLPATFSCGPTPLALYRHHHNRNLPANFVWSLRDEEADIALPNDETSARVNSELASLILRTADRHQQNSELRITNTATTSTRMSHRITER